jgi:hypothetical protein
MLESCECSLLLYKKWGIYLSNKLRKLIVGQSTAASSALRNDVLMTSRIQGRNQRLEQYLERQAEVRTVVTGN